MDELARQKTFYAKNNKNSTQKAHFKKRFKQRLKIDCTRKIYLDIEDQIYHPAKRLVLLKQSNRVRWYGVNINNSRCIIVYDSIRGVPVTIFAEKHFNEFQQAVIHNLDEPSYKRWIALVLEEVK